MEVRSRSELMEREILAEALYRGSSRDAKKTGWRDLVPEIRQEYRAQADELITEAESFEQAVVDKYYETNW